MDTIKPEAPAPTSRYVIDEFVDLLDEILLPNLIRNHESESGLHLTSIHARFGLQLLFGLRNSATIYQEAMQYESLSALEEDLDRLLQLGEGEATACREATVFPNYE
jgi:hypothetical protein